MYGSSSYSGSGGTGQSDPYSAGPPPVPSYGSGDGQHYGPQPPSNYGNTGPPTGSYEGQGRQQSSYEGPPGPRGRVRLFVYLFMC